MNNVIPFNKKTEDKPAEGSVIAPEFKKVRDVEFAISTQVFSNSLTTHAQRIAALKPNQRLIVNSLNVVDEDFTTVTGEIQEAFKN